MSKLKYLLKGVSIINAVSDDDIEIAKIEFDSRKIGEKDMFVAQKGVAVNGHDYIVTAIENGANCVVCEELPENQPSDVVFIKVENTTKALGRLAANYFNHPTSSLKLIGVTGTNGKTTVVSLLYDLFVNLGYKVGKLTTIHNMINGRIIPTNLTTPDVLTTNRLLSEMVEDGCEFAFMEVSSHAIHQGRIEGLEFTGGLFTNMSHDHLDYHKTFAEYIKAKKTFFDKLPKESFALVNIDDKRGEVMMQNSLADKNRYSLRRLADFKGKIIENTLTGLHFEINGIGIIARLIGEFNAYNLLAVYGCAILLEQESDQVLVAISKLVAPEGRFDYVVNLEKNIIGIVDYAHTPDALEKVLSTIKDIQKSKSSIITVVGCGGDRDKTKRPIMAKIGYEASNQLILTSDNPRTEDPETILDDMENGLEGKDMSKVLRITDRKQAIKIAARLANRGDVILIAGKGHEKYQDISGVKHPFDDKILIKEALGIIIS